MEPEPEMSGGGPLPGGQFETLLPGGAVSKAGIVFKAKDASGAVVNRWPQVFKIKSGSWAAEMAGDELRPGCALVSINDAPVTTLEAAKTQLSAAQKLCTYDQPFIRMVWQRAEEADPPGGVDAAPRDLSFPVRRWHDTQWCRCWLTFSAGVVKVYDSPGFGSRPDTAQAEPMVTFDMSDGVTRWESDAISRERMILDNSAQLAHLKFGDADACSELARALEASASLAGGHSAAAAAAAAQAAEAAARPVLQYEQYRGRFPFKIGKYWLGPMDPSKKWDPDDERFRGGYGYVCAGINSETGEHVCCKMNHNLEYEGTEEHRREVCLMSGMKHPNVVDLKDVVKDYPPGSRPGGGAQQKKMLIMIMEKLTGGELFSEVLDNGGLSEPRARELFRHILVGMAYCHGRQLVHRDIKLENLLLTADKKTVKIADFGLAKDTSERSAKTVIGTLKYIAPEVLAGEGVAGEGYDGFKADMWSCGVCLFCMTECRFPFSVTGDGGAGAHGVHTPTHENQQVMQALKAARYRLSPKRSAAYVSFLKRLLCVDVSQRYTAEEALRDPWVRGDDWAVSDVDEIINGLDKTTPTYPDGHTQEEWMAKLRELRGAQDDAADEGGEDGF